MGIGRELYETEDLGFGSADDIWKIFAILFINLLIP